MYLYHLLYEAVVKLPDLLRNYGSGVGTQTTTIQFPVVLRLVLHSIIALGVFRRVVLFSQLP